MIIRMPPFCRYAAITIISGRPGMTRKRFTMKPTTSPPNPRMYPQVRPMKMATIVERTPAAKPTSRLI
jgi:hypothetical protein